MHRRHLLQGFIGLLGSVGLGARARADDAGMSRVTAFAFSFSSLDGAPIRLSEHAGKPILIVNTASLCGFTPQYDGLQQLWLRYRDRGLLVVGLPSNDFGGQEPGGADDIARTTHNHGVSFPIGAKVSVRGDHPHPFYKWAATERPLDAPRWNFHKFLIGRDGRIAASFPAQVTPDDPRVLAAIDRQLAPSTEPAQ